MWRNAAMRFLSNGLEVKEKRSISPARIRNLFYSRISLPDRDCRSERRLNQPPIFIGPLRTGCSGMMSRFIWPRHCPAPVVREALFNSWDKNDRKDAKVIMYLLAQGLTKPFYDPLLHDCMHLQGVAGTYQQISLARTRCQHSLVNHYLPQFFPEFERYLHSGRAEWICRFLLRFPVPKSISSLSLDKFLEQAWNLVGKKTAKQHFLTELYETAQKSIALPIEDDAMELLPFRLQLGRYQQLTEHRNSLENVAHGLTAGRQHREHRLRGRKASIERA